MHRLCVMHKLDSEPKSSAIPGEQRLYPIACNECQFVTVYGTSLPHCDRGFDSKVLHRRAWKELKAQRYSLCP